MGMKPRAPNPQRYTVTSCDDCPCLADYHDDDESVCQLTQRYCGPDEENLRYSSGDPAPYWCPLRKQSVLLVLEE